MALTVPPAASSSFSEFGWIFHNNHLDSSIYHDDDDIMEFSDSSADCQTTPPHNQISDQQQQYQVSLIAACKLSPILFTRKQVNACHDALIPRSFHVCWGLCKLKVSVSEKFLDKTRFSTSIRKQSCHRFALEGLVKLSVFLFSSLKTPPRWPNNERLFLW